MRRDGRPDKLLMFIVENNEGHRQQYAGDGLLGYGAIKAVSLFLVVLQTRIEELHVQVDVLFVDSRRAEGVALVVERDIERLSIGAELRALQIAPLVAHGAQCAFLSVFFCHFDMLGQRCRPRARWSMPSTTLRWLRWQRHWVGIRIIPN